MKNKILNAHWRVLKSQDFSTRIKVLSVLLGASFTLLFVHSYMWFQSDYDDVRDQIQLSLSGIVLTLSSEIDIESHYRLLSSHPSLDEI
ncbi:MAG: hypothetical protein SGI87_09605 [Flavobacteriales bacterium]|nr:hypothetical protein [Flavobacteriales bacterium]